jgi:hypothetical protein
MLILSTSPAQHLVRRVQEETDPDIKSVIAEVILRSGDLVDPAIGFQIVLAQVQVQSNTGTITKCLSSCTQLIFHICSARTCE